MSTQLSSQFDSQKYNSSETFHNRHADFEERSSPSKIETSKEYLEKLDVAVILLEDACMIKRFKIY